MSPLEGEADREKKKSKNAIIINRGWILSRLILGLRNWDEMRFDVWILRGGNCLSSRPLMQSHTLFDRIRAHWLNKQIWKPV